MASLSQPTMVLTQSQRHWRAWLHALQTRDVQLRKVALEQLTKFLDYWTAELYAPLQFRGLITSNGRDTPQPESWDEVFNVDTEVLRRPRHGSDEAWVGPYGLDEYAFETHNIMKPLTMNPWENDDGSKETRETLSRYFCGIQRLVIDCPFADVRRTCRKLLDKAKRKRVEIPSLVHDSPSWLIPISEIIGFKPTHPYHQDIIHLSIHRKYISDSDSDSDIEFRSRNSDDEDLQGYGYYTSPETTPRPTFSTPAIPINAPPRIHSRHQLSRNTSQESIVRSASSSHTSIERPYPKQPRCADDLHEFMQNSFIAHGRVTNYAKVLLYMPRYLRCSSTCYEKLIGSSKGLPRPVKTFIALLAAAEMGCQYFVSYFTTKFLEVGGDSTWLRGIRETPAKIQAIANLNRALVEQPWGLTREDVLATMEAKEDEEKWTMTEAVQIITILAMFHAQSAIALSTGVVCEADVFGGTIWRRISKLGDEEASGGDTEDVVSEKNGHGATVWGSRRDIIDRLRTRMSVSGHLSSDVSLESLHKLHLEASRNEKRVEPRTEKAVREVIERTHNGISTNGSKLFTPARSNAAASSKPHPSRDESLVNPIIEDLSRFTINDTPAQPTAFPRTHKFLSSTQYTWDDALQVLQKHIPELASNIAKRFHLPPPRDFLQPHMHDTVDPIPFKDAVQHLSLALLGQMKDTYNYRIVHEFINADLDRFVRRVALDARGTVKGDWDRLRALGFDWSEIVEIGVFASEARFMGVLVYAFRVIERL